MQVLEGHTSDFLANENIVHRTSSLLLMTIVLCAHFAFNESDNSMLKAFMIYRLTFTLINYLLWIGLVCRSAKPEKLLSRGILIGTFILSAADISLSSAILINYQFFAIPYRQSNKIKVDYLRSEHSLPNLFIAAAVCLNVWYL